MGGYSLVSKIYATERTIDVSMFRTQQSSSVDPLYYLLIGAVFLAIVVFAAVYHWRYSRRLGKVDQNYFEKKEQARQKQFDFADDTSERIEMLAQIVDADPDKMLYSSKAFENAVAKLRQKEPNSSLLQRIPALREDLGYTFYNRKVPFICTQMLQTGQKLRVTIKYQGKPHSYVSTILNTTEAEFWVKPPNAGGKSVDLSRFKHFGFSVFRKNDGEYRFACPLIKQIEKPTSALVMSHVSKIKKLKAREHERYRLQLKKEFFFSDLKTSSSCIGIVMDISIGGMRVLVKSIPEGVVQGSQVFFKLEEAGIQQEIRAEVVRISQQKDKIFMHLRFQDMSELNRLHIQKFVADKTPIKTKA
jgi:c-di-GMP-binding flagellar brake protein YcgR